MPEFSPTTTRPMLQTRYQAVAAGHYLASLAGLRIMERGGNAIDAGVATAFCINVVQADMTNIGGVAPIIIYLAETQQVLTISGLGPWPRKTRVEYFRDDCEGRIPSDVTNAVVPSTCDAWLTALGRFGRLSLAEVLEPAIELATEGFPVTPFMGHMLGRSHPKMSRWPTSIAYLRPDGSALRPGDRLVQPELAATLRAFVDAERGAAHHGREAAIRTARDLFYKGDLAEKMARFSQSRGGFMDYDDLASFSVAVEEPIKTSYRGYDVYACGAWCQGGVVPATLNILEQYDLASLGHNTPAYLHLLTEALKLGFADRNAYYGDPNFVRVPIRGIVSKEYARRQASRISLERAFPAMPDPGDPWLEEGESGLAGVGSPAARPGSLHGDTSYICVVDSEGNGFSSTPSDGVLETPVVPGVGTILSSRGRQSWVERGHPSSIEPGKRPHLTPNPGIILKDGKLDSVYGTPGGDVQPQAMVQYVVNTIDFGLDPQEAIEAPRLASYSFPGATVPHPYNPGLLMVEGRMPEPTVEALAELGHTIGRWPDYTSSAGAVCAIQCDGRWGPRVPGADPRRVAYAIGW